MSVRGAAFLGIGSMVGAGIFALLGEAGAVAGSAVWISFLIAGVVASLQGYAVAKLGATYPSSGGIITFLLKGFGPGHFTAVTSWLLYFASIIVTAMVSVSFGSYDRLLVIGEDADRSGRTIFTIGGDPAGRGRQHRRRHVHRPDPERHRRDPAGGVRGLHRGHPQGDGPVHARAVDLSPTPSTSSPASR